MCDSITKAGTKCIRMAKVGNQCLQHSKSAGKNTKNKNVKMKECSDSCYDCLNYFELSITTTEQETIEYFCVCSLYKRIEFKVDDITIRVVSNDDIIYFAIEKGTIVDTFQYEYGDGIEIYVKCKNCDSYLVLSNTNLCGSCTNGYDFKNEFVILKIKYRVV